MLDYWDEPDGRIKAITAPKALPSDTTRAQHSYLYNDGVNPKTATVTYAGITGTRTVAYNDYAQGVKDTDPTGEFTETFWNVTADRPERVKDPAGFTSTTIFDDAQRPTDSYGPAPDAWFGSDNKPTSGYMSSVPRSQTFYDEGIVGLQVAYWNTTDLTVAAVAHDTGNVGTSGAIDKSWGTASPATGVNADGWSARITGEITIATVGTIAFLTYSDDGTRLYIDDKLVIDGWTNGAAIRGGEFSNLVANSKHRIRLEYYDSTGAAEVHLYWAWQGQASAIVPGANLKARYGLVTKQIDPDAKTSTISYAAPHLGLATATTTDPSGVAPLTEQTGYETYGASGSYLRRISRTLPAGNQWTYAYYGATEPKDNPCPGGATGINQGGMLKTRTGPDPDNAAGGETPRVEEFVYDTTGRIAASRVNSGAWTCPTFDTRGRVVTITIPAFDAQTSARTVTNDYAVPDTNPLVGSMSDDAGTITATVDLLGRGISYTDVWGQVTATSYDHAGRATDSNGPLGAQHVDYDDAGRPTAIKLGGNTIAVPAYDAYGRFDSVAYPTGSGNAGNGTNLAPLTRDSLGRVTGITWRDPTNATLTSDAVTRSVAGRVVDQSIDSVDAHSGDNFVYDGAGRLTTAYVPGHTLVYSYAATGGCGSLTAAGKNTNRTSKTDTPTGGSGVTRTYCYDYADRLTSTTEPGLTGTISYDTHGNTTLLGGETFRYDGADRHVSSTASGTTVTYKRDATDRIIERTQTGPGPITWRATSTPTQTDGSSTTVNIARPTGTQNGDVLVAHIAVRTNTTITKPSGWTQIRTIAEGSTVRGGTYWHLAAGGDPSSWNWTLASAQPAVGSITAYAGVNTSTPIEDDSTKNETSSTTPTARSVTTTSYGAVLITAYALTTATTVTPPTGLTERIDAASAGATPVTAEYADTILGAAGATGDRDATVATAVASANITIALKPATVTETQRYGYTGGGDTPDLTLDAANNQVIERSIGLPGGASITTRATGDVWSYPNIHGDIVLTANSSGAKTGGTFQYDPYGNELSGLPDNSAGAYDFGWLGQYQRGLEHAGGLQHVTEMGARQYSSSLGRFLEVDPIDGGSDNDYEYASGDPINNLDLDGLINCKKKKNKNKKPCKKNKDGCGWDPFCHGWNGIKWVGSKAARGAEATANSVASAATWAWNANKDVRDFLFPDKYRVDPVGALIDIRAQGLENLGRAASDVFGCWLGWEAGKAAVAKLALRLGSWVTSAASGVGCLVFAVAVDNGADPG